jgi:hypothetical protein
MINMKLSLLKYKCHILGKHNEQRATPVQNSRMDEASSCAQEPNENGGSMH